MSSVEAQALREHPELVHLVRLRERGWEFVSPQWEDGCPVELHGYRRYRNATDVIRVRQSDDVVAQRISADHPPTVVWERAGSLAVVVGAMLALPDPDAPGEPTGEIDPVPEQDVLAHLADSTVQASWQRNAASP